MPAFARTWFFPALALILALAQIAAMRTTALIGFSIGLTLGCLFGAVMSFLPSRTDSTQPPALSVNQNTGKPQLHVKGRPEIK